MGMGMGMDFQLRRDLEGGCLSYADHACLVHTYFKGRIVL